MFFQIGKLADNFPCQFKHKNLFIGTDSGWTETRDQHNNLILYKGYLDDGDLDSSLEKICNQEDPLYHGNFCVIKCFDKGVTVKADKLRSFPIWYDKDQGITNLQTFDRTCWTDSYVMLDFDFNLIESKFQIIDNISNQTLSLNEVVKQVDTRLSNKIQNFFNNNKLPVKVFLSGGIDTMFLYSYIKKFNIDHELVKCSHIDYDYFYLKNHYNLSKFWGYNQIHHWKEHCVLASGAPGDEFTVRSPTTANLILRYYNTSITELLNNNLYKDSLHYTYYNKEKYKLIWNKQEETHFANLSDAIKQSINLNLNDWQHWHLGNTLTYTPFRDITLFELIARLEFDPLCDQIMNSIVQKAIIEMNAPELLSGLSFQKNSNNCMENLVDILKV